MDLFGIVRVTHQCWGEIAPCSPRPLQPLRRRGRLINRPLQPMKTGGNNPDKRQIWSLSYKTNFNCTPFFKSSSGWRTRELNPCGCRICFSLIALSGYLIRWQMTKTPPVTDRLSLSPSLSLSDTQTVPHNAFSVFPTHIRSCTSSHTVLPFSSRTYTATVDHWPSFSRCVR